MSAQDKRKENAQKKRANRRLVPCGCTLCGNIKLVTQDERQRHLKSDRLRSAESTTRTIAAIRSLAQQLGPPPLNDSSSAGPSVNRHSTHLAQYVPLNTMNGQASMRDLELQSLAIHQAYSVPSAEPPCVQGAQPSDGQGGEDAAELAQASNGMDEEDGVLGEATVLGPTALIQNDGFDPLCDDDWEDGPAPEDTTDPVHPLRNSLPPLPPAPLPVLPSPQPDSTPPKPIATFIPPFKEEENSPDPFLNLKTTSSPPIPPTPAEVHPDSGIYMLYMVVVWLHSQFHLPFRACNALAVVCLLIIKSFGITIAEPMPLVTLPRIMGKLDVEPAFDILPLCPQCLEVYPSSGDTPASCRKCATPLFKPTRSSTTSNPRVPRLQAPFMSIQAQLASLLAVPGVEAELDKWRMKARYPGHYCDIFDGAVTKSLPDPDGRAFFRNDGVEFRQGPDGELRIGLTLGLDWFSYLRSQIAPSHSSCPISISVANLPAHLRYRTANLLLVGIMPGPKEQPPDECQRFLRVLVNELLRLWEDGFTVVTPSCPRGRRVRVILICICCDKPAAHKVGGFGSHSHTFFCTRCWISQADKGKPEAFQRDGFRPRTDQEHRMAGMEYAGLSSDAAREAFVKEKAARWSEFARLPYFDLVRMIVIDPMHNLLLGLVKTHFYHIWVQGKILRKTKELHALHEFLRQFVLPSYAGRLPALVGEPAGGSLTADQWMLLATVVGPMAIPQIWDDFMGDPVAAAEQRQASIKARYEKRAKDEQAKKERAAAKRAAAAAAKASKRPRTEESGGVRRAPEPAPAPRAPEPEEDDDITSCLHPDDPANFLKLSQALRLMLKRDITDWELNEAEALLESYCTELLTLYGTDVIKPNHHYCIHTPDCVRDFGPLHEFWTFLFERLNKVLKAYKTNNRNGGELETTFFREFHRTIATSRLVARSTANDPDGLYASATQAMFSASADDRGTVQALAKELDESRVDEDIAYSLSPRFLISKLPGSMYSRVLRYLTALYPTIVFRSLNHPSPAPGSLPIPQDAMFFDYAVIKGRRYMASNRASTKGNSFVEVFVSDRGETCVGELLDIMHILVDEEHKYVLGHFRWLRPFAETGVNPSVTPWGAFASVGVKLWHDGPPLTGSSYPTLLPLHMISHSVAIHRITVGNIAGLATISLVN